MHLKLKLNMRFQEEFLTVFDFKTLSKDNCLYPKISDLIFNIIENVNILERFYRTDNSRRVIDVLKETIDAVLNATNNKDLVYVLQKQFYAIEKICLDVKDKEKYELEKVIDYCVSECDISMLKKLKKEPLEEIAQEVEKISKFKISSVSPVVQEDRYYFVTKDHNGFFSCMAINKTSGMTHCSTLFEIKDEKIYCEDGFLMNYKNEDKISCLQEVFDKYISLTTLI